jgi:hypothetical protein
MIANTPRFSRHAVRYRRVENLDPCDLVDEEHPHRRHVVDSSHNYKNNPFLSRRELFLL